MLNSTLFDIVGPYVGNKGCWGAISETQQEKGQQEELARYSCQRYPGMLYLPNPLASRSMQQKPGPNYPSQTDMESHIRFASKAVSIHIYPYMPPTTTVEGSPKP